MKKITVKLALFFIAIICVSSILSFLFSIYFTDGVKDEIKQSQEAIAELIIIFRTKTDYNLNEIAHMISASSSMYEVRKTGSIDNMSLTPEDMQQIHEKKIVSIPHSDLHAIVTMLMVDDSYVKISLHPNNTILKIAGSRVWSSLAFSVIIGAFLIILLAKKVVDPVLKLNSATQEVARGNFDINLEHKSNDEIGQLTKNFNQMTKELKNIELLRKDFVSNVSHEFKTPIASIQGFAKLLRGENISEEEKQDYAGIIIEETARLSKLSSNILKISKLENQDIIAKKYLFSLDEQIRKCILLLEHEWSKKNIVFDINLQNVEYLGNEELLEQVWLNLLSNAIKFSHTNGKINITLEQTPSSVKFTIRDYGIGMSEVTMARIFEKFYQGEGSHSDEGNGLGLPLVKRILELLGGNIQVESKLNEGSVFSVELF